MVLSYIFNIYIYILLYIIIQNFSYKIFYIFYYKISYKYISDLKKRLVKSDVEGKEEKNYVVKFCRQARVKLTRTT